jgi:hypothetical protein
MQRTKEYYKVEFVQKERSMHDIAEEHGTYVNKIRRELLSFGYQPRGKSEAQKIALKTGRHKHPTKGRERPPEVRSKISASVAEFKHHAKTEEG